MVDMQHPDISVVIPTRNREDVLEECITRLGQEAAAAKILVEAIVLDTSSCPTPFSYPGNNYLSVRYRYDGDRPFSLIYARNQGLTLARGEIVAYIDDDCFVLPGWLPALLEPYQSPQTVATGGRIVYHPWHPVRFGEPVAILNVDADTVWAEWDRVVAGPIAVPHLPGGNFSVLKSRALAVGGFDPQFTGSANLEETDFFIRVGALGGNIVFHPLAVVEHRAAPRVDGITRSGTNYLYRKSAVRNRIYLLRKHGSRAALRRGLARQLRDLAAGVYTSWRQAVVFAAASVVGLVAGLTTPVTARWKMGDIPRPKMEGIATRLSKE